MHHHSHRQGHRHAHEEISRDDQRRHGHGHRHGRRRLFDHGELRLVILSLIAERPRHGYEIIKAIEDRLGGAYTPSPGVVYPTLTMLEDLGQVAVSPVEAGRKLHTITEAGQAYLAANEVALRGAVARMDEVAGDQAHNPPAAIVRAMENVKVALRLRLAAGKLAPDELDRVAAALDAAATQISRI